MAESHIGYAARTAERFRYEGDPNEVMLRISREAAEDILMAYNSLNATYRQGRPIEAVAKALEAIGIE